MTLYGTTNSVPDANQALASFTIPTSDLLRLSQLQSLQDAFISIELGASAFAVTPGDVYAIGLVAAADPSTRAPFHAWMHGANVGGHDLYTGGKMYGQVYGVSNFSIPNNAVDLGFRTYVSPVPEPSLFLMTSSGALLVGGWNALRRRRQAGDVLANA